MKRLLLLEACFVLFLSACCYKVEHAEEQIMTLEVPYIKGDFDGRLTDAVTQKLLSSSRFNVISHDAQYRLEIKIKKNKNVHVGYRYDRIESTGQLIDRLIPIEERKKMIVEVSVLDSHELKLAYGPYEVEAFADFDFVNFDTYHDLAFIDLQGIPQSSLAYSLGQLDSNEGANHSVYDALYDHLAQKILILLQNL